VTWVGPAPKLAKVTPADPDLFATLEGTVGPEIPDAFPERYTDGLTRVDVFNSSILWDIDEVIGWERRYGIKMESGPKKIFENYIRNGHAIFGTLVGHPQVVDPDSFRACSVVLQRGIIVMSGQRETLSLRSYFHSANDGGEAVNFVPSGGVTFSFETDELWYPLELTGVMPEPVSFLELDVLTKEPLQLDLPDQVEAAKGRRLESTAEVDVAGARLYAARLSARLDVEGERVIPDLRIALDGYRAA
jgi:hypothetical protein